ncbi:protein-L-isoaspartate O-methyltransferase family protein [Pandoraea oxalativorans]|uniref:protein-L-isoaspartate O-methyltransferase family protein n=1 Tax=Pandoraea oxalativorans TaxID=573737 RepID=UPI0014716645|nr:methyltransferase domain-containing protein [Pandoraea oxalativorans]
MRATYARQILALANASENHRLERAFAAVPRETFLGEDRWRIPTSLAGYTPLPENDPVLIYQDVVVGLATQRGVNNGSPALHARWLNAMAPHRGEVVAHLGAGAGYYTAILAELVGSTGRVIALEYDEDLCTRAVKNLAHRTNVQVVHADGAAYPVEPVDGIYVNFGVARPARSWIDRLKPGGRLVPPLGAPEKQEFLPGRVAAQAIGLLVTRVDNGFGAASLGPASFIFAEGALGATTEEVNALRVSLQNANDGKIRSLLLDRRPTGGVWLAASNRALSSEAPVRVGGREEKALVTPGRWAYRSKPQTGPVVFCRACTGKNASGPLGFAARNGSPQAPHVIGRHPRTPVCKTTPGGKRRYAAGGPPLPRLRQG